MAEDGLKRALSALDALRANAPEQLDQDDVDQYHYELDRLRELGYEVEEYRIPGEWLKKRLRGFSYIERGRERWSDPLLDRRKFLTKIDALLGLFSLEGKKIGFEPPPKEA